MNGRRGTDKEAWAQMLQQNDEKHEEAHARLRADVRALETEHQFLKTRLAAMEMVSAKQEDGLIALRESPIDIGKIVFNPRMVMAIVGLAITIVGGNWISTAPIRDGQTKTQTAVEVLQAQVMDNNKTEDERARAQANAMDGVAKQLEMRRLEIQQIGNNFLQLQQQVQQLQQRGR